MSEVFVLDLDFIPKYLSEVLGKKFVKDASKGERFSFELID
jgi:hypothetical protein